MTRINPSKQTIPDGTIIIARVTCRGGKWGIPYKYTKYEADCSLKTGYRYIRDMTDIIYPTKTNDNYYNSVYEYDMIKSGYILVYGRPVKNVNAPNIKN